ncbi:hypothetical protein [Sphingomonas sp.]|uniref:hypothetical protein n=1 Tax=Sphingomonas sp. TaxID=28214 RepID=UPI0025D799C9|nr:hypothetical protein [Sphingomonas sp.]
MEAWGSDSNLFAQKTAELVTDAALSAEPLAHPGTVIKRLRGTVAEQIAALPPDVTRPRKANEVEPIDRGQPTRAVKTSTRAKILGRSKPRPDRAALISAEKALEYAMSAHVTEQKKLKNRQAALEREKRDMDRNNRQRIETLEDDRARAEAAYGKVMKAWQR